MNTRLLPLSFGFNFLKSLNKKNTAKITEFKRLRYYWKTMDSKILQPPDTVRGMRELQREAFIKRVKVPCLKVQSKHANQALPLLKESLLKMQHLRPVREEKKAVSAETNGEDKLIYKEILLHPAAVSSWESLPTEKLQNFEISASDFYFSELELTYDNWRADEVLDFVLSNEVEGLTSYSRIGHIIHLNLRDHLLPYKKLIAEVFADKMSGVRTVVNKSSNIDNTYRNFELELLHGEPEYKVETKENGIFFEFDFSRVYWNPRLSTEHERIVKILQPNDVLYDVFAGVGPFSVPAAKKRCHVLANDLNPESFRWLEHNIKRNKCANQAKLFNKDGRAFILEDLKADLLKRLQKPDGSGQIHVTMNLPAMATEFLPSFCGLFNKDELPCTLDGAVFPIVHVYTFAKGEDTKSLALALVEKNLGFSLGENLKSVNFVRNVAPNKDMYRISFKLIKEILFGLRQDDLTQRAVKRVSCEHSDTETNSKIKCTQSEIKL